MKPLHWAMVGALACSAAAFAAPPSAGSWQSKALQTPYQPDLPLEDKVAGLSQLWSEARFAFANFHLRPELDWDDLYRQTLPRVIASKSTLEYYRILSEFYAQLQDGHSNVYFPPALRDEVYARPPLRTSLIEGRVIITELRSPSLLAQGLAIGQEVLAVDGVPVQDYAARFVAPYVSASTAQDRAVRTFNYSLLAGDKRKPVTLALRDAGGQELVRAISRGDYSDVAKPVNFVFRMLPGKIAYVALNSFQDREVPRQFAAAFDQIAASDGLVLDVRENGGGNSDNGWKILSYLTGQSFDTIDWMSRQYQPVDRTWSRRESWLHVRGERWDPADRFYSKPVVVLTSARTFSAAEDFAVTFDTMKRGLIVGEPTGGSTGEALNFALPGGGSARICAKRVTYVDGREYVGVGVLPQVHVAPTIASIRSGRDVVLEAGIKALQQVSAAPQVGQGVGAELR